MGGGGLSVPKKKKKKKERWSEVERWRGGEVERERERGGERELCVCICGGERYTHNQTNNTCVLVLFRRMVRKWALPNAKREPYLEPFLNFSHAYV